MVTEIEVSKLGYGVCKCRLTPKTPKDPTLAYRIAGLLLKNQLPTLKQLIHTLVFAGEKSCLDDKSYSRVDEFKHEFIAWYL